MIVLIIEGLKIAHQFNFRIDLNEFHSHGKIVTALYNGQNIKSEPSIQKLNGE